MVTLGSLCIGETLLAMGRCSLLPDDVPTVGTLEGAAHSLLKYDTLRLVLPDEH